MKKNKRIKNVIIGFMLVVLAYNVINQQIAMKRIDKEFSEKKEELQLLKIENERLKEQVEAAENNPLYMLRLAREKFGYVLPGETTIVDSQSDSE